jgi:tRNA pseudouridine55 synthase
VKKLKVGHAGTLDPLATGVMIICTGKATKRIEEFQYQTKEYIATICLGATTPSYDLEKEIDATYPTEHITPEMVAETLSRFLGEIQQIPPPSRLVKLMGPELTNWREKGRKWSSSPKHWLLMK